MSAKPQPQTEEPTTITGKPITAPVSFRLPTDQYRKLLERAEQEGKKVAVLLEEWVIEKLDNDPFRLGDRVRIAGDSHPWNGHIGTYQGMEDTLAGTMHRVELDNGQSCFADLYQLKEARGA